jgi:hypothetical protein
MRLVPWDVVDGRGMSVINFLENYIKYSLQLVETIIYLFVGLSMGRYPTNVLSIVPHDALTVFFIAFQVQLWSNIVGYINIMVQVQLVVLY